MFFTYREELTIENGIRFKGFFTYREELTVENGIGFKGFFRYRELTIENGIGLKGSKVATTSSGYCVNEKTHYSHVGIEASLQRVRDVSYSGWPGMTAQIREFVLRSPQCK